MKQIIALFFILISVMLFAAWLQQPDNASKLFSTIQKQNKQVEEKSIVKVGNSRFEVEIAKTPEERKVGLSKHLSLAEGRGMLFVLDVENAPQPAFWMKGMSFPIDIIWIDDERVIQITPDVPTVPADLPERRIPTYKPSRPVDYVLEINAGEASKKGIKVGDAVELTVL